MADLIEMLDRQSRAMTAALAEMRGAVNAAPDDSSHQQDHAALGPLVVLVGATVATCDTLIEAVKRQDTQIRELKGRLDATGQ
jgi:hypothetical protein